jgi:alkylated DNA repair dioxygenase AlkB
MIETKYIPNYIENSNNFEYFKNNLEWVQRENCPRKEYWDTSLRKPYTYGQGRGIRTYEPNKPIDKIQVLRYKLLEDFGVFFEGCFLNFYETKKDHLGWHSDDDLGIDHSKPIMIITLGGKRELNWKPIGSKGLDSISSQMLEGGSLFIMPSGMQQTHYHRIPKAGFESDPRISLTFRSLI